jgi:hypothetical protein
MGAAWVMGGIALCWTLAFVIARFCQDVDEDGI